MFAKTVLATAALVGLAAASPTPLNSRHDNTSIFEVIALHSTSPIQGARVSALRERFFVGNGIQTYCPATGQIDCSKARNQTVFSFVPSDSNPQVFLADTAAGGQQVYVDAGTGVLGFSVQHSSVPEKTYSGPFEYVPQSTDGSVGTLTFENEGFNACPTGDIGPSGLKIYQIYAHSVKSDEQTDECIDVAFGTAIYGGPLAYAYA